MKHVYQAEIDVGVEADNETTCPASEILRKNKSKGELGRRIYSAYLQQLFNGSL